MVEGKLTSKQIIHNSGADLWDFIFEAQPLSNMHFDDDELTLDNTPDWYDNGIEWVSEWLLDDEKWNFIKDQDKIIYTSFGRLANIERKRFKGTSMQGNTIAGNINSGAISLTKLVRETWGIELTYEGIPRDVRADINMSNAAKWIREKYG